MIPVMYQFACHSPSEHRSFARRVFEPWQAACMGRANSRPNEFSSIAEALFRTGRMGILPMHSLRELEDAVPTSPPWLSSTVVRPRASVPAF
jgi:hypothetical protein